MSMSSKTLDKKYDVTTSEELVEEIPVDFTKIITPFHKFGRIKNPSYIYDGEEKIPFKERHPFYILPENDSYKKYLPQLIWS